MMVAGRYVVAVLVSVVLALSTASAHDHTKPAQAGDHTTPPLYSNLGDLTYPVTTVSKEAQQYFDQGLRLTYAFNHAEALRAYREAQRRDPQCAMCYWGEAFVLGANINAPMGDAAISPAVAAAAKAQQLAAKASAREQALIAALAKRYSADTKADKAALAQAYADAMAEALRRFPDDPEIGVLYVDAVMNLSPWDYWEADGITPKGKIGEAIRTAENVMAANPNHPGAIHLYIHLTEASTTPERAEGYANRLAALMPGAGHLVHMPSHTFYRIGRFQDSVVTNKAAVKADEDYLAQVKARGIYAYGYYPHNIHFVLVSAQMAGDKQTALEYAKRLEGKVPDAVAEQIGWIQAIKTAPYFAYAQFAEPDTVLALPAPDAKFPFVQAMWHYARGMAYIGKKDVERARIEAAKIAELNQSADFQYLLDWAVPAPDVLRIARHVIEGRIAQVQGQLDRAVKEFQVAVSIQDSLAYMEPPYWYYPVRQSLGAALLASGKAAEAEKVFKESLKRVPKNGWALYGLMKAQEARNQVQQAKATAQRFKQVWAGDPTTLTIDQL